MSIARSTLAVSGLTFAGYIVSFSVQILFARAFGTEGEADAWFAAVALPNFLAIVLSASLAKAFLPMFVVRLEEDRDAAYRELSGVLNLTLLTLSALALVVSLWPAGAEAVLFPHFADEQAETGRRLISSSIWAVPAVGASILLGSSLQATRRFAFAAATTLLQPIGVLVSLLLLGPRLGVFSMAIGLVAGSVLQFALIAPAAFWRGAYRPILALGAPAVRQVLAVLPALCGLAALIACHPLLEKRFASGLPEGAVSTLDYGRRPLNLLACLLVGPISLTSFTVFAESAARGQISILRSQVVRTSMIVLLLLVPPCIFLAIYGEEFLRILYERGQFWPEDTANAASALLLLLPITIFSAVGQILVHAFMARRRFRAPLLASGLGVLVYAALGHFVARAHGYRGLAVLQSAALGVSVTVLLVWLRRDLGRPAGEKLLGSLGSIALGGIAVAGTLLLTSSMAPARQEPLAIRAMMLLVLGLLAGVIYLGILSLFRNPHLAQLIRSMARRRAR